MFHRRTLQIISRDLITSSCATPPKGGRTVFTYSEKVETGEKSSINRSVAECLKSPQVFSMFAENESFSLYFHGQTHTWPTPVW